MFSENVECSDIMKRIKRVHENPNILFMQWLTEFRDEARSKGSSGLIKIYNMCIDNLSRYLTSYFDCFPTLNSSFEVPSPT